MLGHEAAGIVEAVGPGVTRCARRQGRPDPAAAVRALLLLHPRPADAVRRVLVGPVHLHPPDGTSPLSRDGELVYRGLGMGGWAEYVVLPQDGVVKVDDDVDLAEACVIGCAVQTGVGAVLNTRAWRRAPPCSCSAPAASASP